MENIATIKYKSNKTFYFIEQIEKNNINIYKFLCFINKIYDFSN